MIKTVNLNCADCGVAAWEIGEDFYVNDELWYSIMPKSKQERIICIGCFEKRLKRKLVKKDFKHWFRNNGWYSNPTKKINNPPSEKLKDRLKLKG